MKEFMKRAAALLAAVMMVASLSTGALAAPDATQRPRSSASSSQSSTSDSSKSTSDSDSSSDSSKSSSDNDRDSDSSDGDEDTDSSRSSSDGDSSSSSSTSKSGTAKKVEEKPSQTQPPAVTQAPAAAVSNKSYTTKGGAFLWFLLSIIVNTAISFAIAKRFYKMAKQSNRVQAEIRALRHDIEEKFADSVDGFAEPAVDITNTNDDYSFGADGIKMTPASTTDGASEDMEATYKKWEETFGARHRQRQAAVDAQQRKADYDDAEDIEDESTSYDAEEPRRSSKKYQPSRGIQRTSSTKKSGNKPSPRKSEKGGENGNIGGKVKNIMGKLFPMDEDDDE